MFNVLSKKAATILLSCCFFLSVPSLYAQDKVECLPDHVCLTKDEAYFYADIVEHQKCMIDVANSGDIELHFDPYHIIVTEQGQVFDQELMTFLMVWCDFELEFALKPNLVVSIKESKPESRIGFTSRFRVGLSAQVSSTSSDIHLDVNALWEIFQFHHFHVAPYVGIKSYGLSIGMDITKNLDAFLGVGHPYRLDFSPIPTFLVGFSFSLN